MTTLLRTSGLSAGYHGMPAIHDLDIELSSGEFVAVLGANGAGKTTTIRALSGQLRPMSGQVFWEDAAERRPTFRRVRAGMAVVSQERAVFMSLTVKENLRMVRVDPEKVLDIFPELTSHLKRRVGLLSGGQQQMLTLGRALASNPKALLVDELSFGLAPSIVERLIEAMRRAVTDDELGVIMVEQHARTALRVADRAYVLRRGRLVISGSGDELSSRLTSVQEAYL